MLVMRLLFCFYFYISPSPFYRLLQVRGGNSSHALLERWGPNWFSEEELCMCPVRNRGCKRPPVLARILASCVVVPLLCRVRDQSACPEFQRLFLSPVCRDIDSAKATDEPTDAVSGPTTRRTALGLAAGFLGIEFGLKPSGAEIPIHLYREGPEELRYNDLEVGEGAEPQKGDLVTCSFEGTVVQTGERCACGLRARNRNDAQCKSSPVSAPIGGS